MRYIFIALCSFQSAFTFLISCDLGKNLARLYFILTLYQSGKGSSKKANNKINLCMTQTLENVELRFFSPTPSTLTVKLHFLVGKDYILNLFHAK